MGKKFVRVGLYYKIDDDYGLQSGYMNRL